MSISVVTRDPRAVCVDGAAAEEGANSAAPPEWEAARWLNILGEAFGHTPLLLVAQRDGRTVGHLALCLMRSRLFGRFLVSLPYLNTAGVVADDAEVARALVDRAVRLAAEHDVRFLELRHETPVSHPALTETLTSKVHMRLRLPATAEELMASLKSKRRSQLKSGLSRGFEVRWGGVERLDDFYAVFARNMRDLGTPVYGRRLFRSIIDHWYGDAEFCCVYDGRQPVAAALLLHGRETTAVPSASSLRAYNPTNVNMAMYWHLLERAIGRGRQTFDFGRSTVDGPTFAFKKQWGAEPEPACWQYHLRQGTADAARPESAKFRLAIRLWQRLPVGVANLLGPRIVRGIP